MTPEQWAELRASDIWQNVVAPVLLHRQKEIDRGLRKAADKRTMHLLQGAAAEVETLLGDPAADAMRRAREAEHAKHAPEEIDSDGRRDPRGNDRARRLAERKRSAGG